MQTLIKPIISRRMPTSGKHLLEQIHISGITGILVIMIQRSMHIMNSLMEVILK